MEIEFASFALGFLGIGLFFFGFFLGQKSSPKIVEKPKDLSEGVKLDQVEINLKTGWLFPEDFHKRKPLI